MNPSSTDIIRTARRWVNVPWAHQGRSLHGIDCVGLVVLTGQSLGLPVEDYRSYSEYPDGDTLHNELDRQGFPRIPQSSLGPGSIATFYFSHPSRPCHVGIIGLGPRGRLTLIHTWRGKERCVEHGFNTNSVWWRHMVRVYEFPTVGE